MHAKITLVHFAGKMGQCYFSRSFKIVSVFFFGTKLNHLLSELKLTGQAKEHATQSYDLQ